MANDDMGKTCYDTVVTIDVLDNDTDVGNTNLTITQVNGVAIAEGGVPVDVDGVLVSLGGQLRLTVLLLMRVYSRVNLLIRPLVTRLMMVMVVLRQRM